MWSFQVCYCRSISDHPKVLKYQHFWLKSKSNTGHLWFKAYFENYLKHFTKFNSVLVNMVLAIEITSEFARHVQWHPLFANLLTKSEGGANYRLRSILTCHPDVPTPPFCRCFYGIWRRSQSNASHWGQNKCILKCSWSEIPVLQV